MDANSKYRLFTIILDCASAAFILTGIILKARINKKEKKRKQENKENDKEK